MHLFQHLCQFRCNLLRTHLPDNFPIGTNQILRGENMYIINIRQIIRLIITIACSFQPTQQMMEHTYTILFNGLMPQINRGIIICNTDYLQSFLVILVPQFNQMRVAGTARYTPRSPKVQNTCPVNHSNGKTRH